jgi:ribosomal-protein-alanine N-acetyltransferase
VIRALTEDDLDSLCALDAASFDVAWPRSQIKDELANPDALVLGFVDHQVLQGAVLARLVLDELWIFRIMVRKEQRRQGVARRLLRALSAQVAKSTPIWLEVSVDNTAAIAFYQREGFELVSRRPGYYAATGPGRLPQDALVMRREPS